MLPTRGYATQGPKSAIEPFQFQRREPSEHDVVIEIAYCGICHSDIHSARDEWGGATYPMVPGHEIAGKVTRVGSKVKKFKVGDYAGVGCFVDSCRVCTSCKDGEEQYCEKGPNFTYNSFEKDGKTPTQGGYSSQIVVGRKLRTEDSARCAVGARGASPVCWHHDLLATETLEGEER